MAHAGRNTPAIWPRARRVKGRCGVHGDGACGASSDVARRHKGSRVGHRKTSLADS
jgi:hypothetical protein